MAKVFEPIQVGPIELKNRIVAEPMLSNTAIDGYVTSAMLDLYAERAAGGAALVTVELTAILKSSRSSAEPGIWDDDFLPGLTALADVIRQGGAKACIQLVHPGRFGNPNLNRAQVVAPSDETPAWMGKKPRGLSTAEVEGIIEAYAQAVLRAKRAGFDAVNLHATHGFLPQQFMSPYTNIGRTDRFAEPTAFITEIIRRAREVAGPNLALTVRIPADEYLGESGITLQMVVETIAPALERAGVHAIDVTTGNHHRFDAVIPPLYYSRATFVPYAEEVKKAVKIPVIGVGRINDPRLIENLIEKERVDLVGLGRQVYADPELPNKMLAGRYDEIRKCLGCDACMGPVLPKSGAICAINPTLMRGKSFPLTRVAKPKKVLVVGGGVAGMEAARVAKLRGHDVTLVERTNRLGGQVNVSAALPHVNTGDLRNYVQQLEGRLDELGVKVELGREATADTVKEMNPDVLLLATGSRPAIPEIPGVDGPSVMNEEDAVLKQDRVGRKVAILGAARGAEVAASLASSGREVAILDEGTSATLFSAPYISTRQRRLGLARLLQHPNIRVLTEVKVREIADGGVTYLDKSGDEQYVEADTIVLAVGRTPSRELERVAGQLVDEVIVIGDASRPRNQLNAIHDGFFAAYGIGDPQGLEAGRLIQIARTAAEQLSPPVPNLKADPEWSYAASLPPLSPGREVRRARRAE